MPGGSDGPGGVFVAGEDWIEYVHEGSDGDGDSHAAVSNAIIAPLPRRKLHSDSKGVMITALTVHRQKKGKKFYLPCIKRSWVMRIKYRWICKRAMAHTASPVSQSVCWILYRSPIR